MVREPIARVRSCYAERFQPLLGKPLEQLTYSEAMSALENMTDAVSPLAPHGCNNEIMRWLSPASAWGDAVINLGRVSTAAVVETKRRLCHCVIGNVAERPAETLAVLRYWFPWIRNYTGDPTQGHHRDRHHAPLPPLPPSTTALIVRYNRHDLVLYRHAMDLFERQVQSLPLDVRWTFGAHERPGRDGSPPDESDDALQLLARIVPRDLVRRYLARSPSSAPPDAAAILAATEAVPLGPRRVYPQGAPPNCAHLWVRSQPRLQSNWVQRNLSVVLLSMVKESDPVELVRQIEYHLVLGLQKAIIFDQSCQSHDIEVALQPYVDVGLVHYNGSFRCRDPGAVVKELAEGSDRCPTLRIGGRAKDGAIGGSMAAMIAACHYPELNRTGATLPLALPLDDDEYIVMPIGDTLQTLQAYLVKEWRKTNSREFRYLELGWYIFGTSGHITQPKRSVVRMFTRRAPVQECQGEISEIQVREAMRQAKRNNLNPPYQVINGTARGKPLMLYGTPDCSTHWCHGPKVQMLSPAMLMRERELRQRGEPTKLSDILQATRRDYRKSGCPSMYIAHYSYQSREHWQAKKARGRLNREGTPTRKGEVPSLYEQVFDDNASRLLDLRIAAIEDQPLRECVASLFQ